MAIPTSYETALTELAALSAATNTEKTAVTGGYTSFDAEIAALNTAITSLSARLATLDTRVSYVKTNFGVAL